MKKSLIYSLLGISSFFIGTISCTNEEPDYFETNSMLVKAPKVIAYSGDYVFGNGLETRGTVTNTSHASYKVQDYQLTENLKQNNPHLYDVMSHAPSAVTDDEWNYVKQYLAEHPNEGGTVCDLTDYFIQWVGKSYDFYDGMTDNNGANHNVVGSNQMDYIEIDGVHLNDYNGSNGPITYCENWPLTSPAYHDSYGDMNQMKYNMYRFYYIEYNGEYGLYLCFDYTTQKNSGEYLPGDGIFNDWVLKITPANGVVTPPGNKDDDDEDGSITTPPADNNEHYDEVEVNLAIDEKEGILESHLSIHVRCATNVEVFIPIPQKYTCEADDMAIVMKHEPNHMGHGGPFEYTYKLKDSDLEVTLHINYEEDGIRIWTTGITEEVIDWCNKKCDDGITFEIWNYFDPAVIDHDLLKEYLNQATIRFIDKTPDYYINAFTQEADGTKDTNDCDVHIVEDQSYEYNDAVVGEHLNNSPYNDIYVKKEN